MLANQKPSRPIIDFGTSGLRGPAESFTRVCVHTYVGAFLDLQDSCDRKKQLFVGTDRRDSSPRIAASVFATARFFNWQPINVGNVPTPALAAYALANDSPAIMITGSHIPETYNGIKFYRRDGELLKEDETSIRERADELIVSDISSGSLQLPEVNGDVARAYVARYTFAFPKTALKGLKIGVDMHSAVGRDLLVEILEALGARCFPFRRSDRFIAVDTEALNDSDMERASSQLKKHKLDAIVSTDGDGDRPLLIDDTGTQINGDVLGALTAKALDIDTIVTPLTSTSAIEQSGWFKKIVRTRIGSPYVVAAMAEQTSAKTAVAGFEANGGFLLGTDINLPNGQLSALPTRDAVLPLITVLAMANSMSLPLSALTDKLPARFMKADRIKQITNEKAQTFLGEIASSDAIRAKVDKRLSNPVCTDTSDGVRMAYADSSIVHFRQSGNAPEMRIYVETGDRELTHRMLGEIKHGLAAFLRQGAKTE